MTATDLYEIVRDVPREAWPELDWHGGRWVDGHTEAYTRPELAEQAFIGSMTAWLHASGYTVDSYSTEAGARLYVRDAHTGNDLGGVTKFSGTSLVAALAAACREVK